ncbi:hypothetical protein [Priestia megaterium]|uniref:hypothetical protein n=1 Tax=Priestia megaterium TaxID=1404 RepID=UPI00234EC8C5|nr:hypothetical protein [Priestia megaterium]MDC7783878.1 hypothetical protein [Priestia megaterium]
MYRPTVRYDDIYRTYVEGLFKATKLDRNQILRCALFAAAYNYEFLTLMNHYKKDDVPLPSPLWSQSSHHLWLEQEANREENGGNPYNDYIERKRMSSDLINVSGEPGISRSISGTTFSPKQQSPFINKEERQDRRQQPIERRTRTLPAIQLSNNGGIRIDLR